MSKSQQEYPILFPKALYDSLMDLSARGYMTPSYLSSLIMHLILPAQFIVEKNNNDDALYHHFHIKTHTFNQFMHQGIQTLEAKNTENNEQEYEIYCCGNGEDAMSILLAYSRIVHDNKNYIFWNYPGVGKSLGPAHSTNDLFKAGYEQAKRLIDKGVEAKKITLHGWSLGGGVAIHVARQLRDEGHMVNLNIDRSFANLASVIPASVDGQLLSSILSLAVFGIAIGTTVASLLASLSLMLASTIATIGYIIALSLDSLDFYPFHMLAFLTNKMTSILAFLFLDFTHFIIAMLGLSIALSMGLLGAILGCLVGSILSCQLLWTNEPWTMPITWAFSAALNSACCEMNSVIEIERLLKKDGDAKISIRNVLDDEIINVGASLLMGLGLEPGRQPGNEKQPLKEKITSFWYDIGGHFERPEDIITSNEENDQIKKWI